MSQGRVRSSSASVSFVPRRFTRSKISIGFVKRSEGWNYLDREVCVTNPYQSSQVSIVRLGQIAMGQGLQRNVSGRWLAQNVRQTFT
jgi:hypothetical protein